MDIQNWILTCAVVALTGVLSFILRTGIKQGLAKIDEVVRELRALSLKLATIDGELRSVKKDSGVTTTRLNEHSTRIRELERELSILKSRG